MTITGDDAELHRHEGDQRARAARSSPTSRPTPTTSSLNVRPATSTRTASRPSSPRTSPSPPASTTIKPLLYDRKGDADRVSFDTQLLRPGRVDAGRPGAVARARGSRSTNGGISRTSASRIFPTTPPRRSALNRRDEPVPVQRRLRRLLRPLQEQKPSVFDATWAGDERLRSSSTAAPTATMTSASRRCPCASRTARTAGRPAQEQPQLGRRRPTCRPSSWACRPPPTAHAAPDTIKGITQDARQRPPVLSVRDPTYTGTRRTSSNYDERPARLRDQEGAAGSGASRGTAATSTRASRGARGRSAPTPAASATSRRCQQAADGAVDLRRDRRRRRPRRADRHVRRLRPGRRPSLPGWRRRDEPRCALRGAASRCPSC